MKKLALLFAMVLGVTNYVLADISVQTKVLDGNSQPPIVGGIINGNSANAIVKKGIIVSSSMGGAIYKEDEYWYNASYYSDDSKSVDSDLNPMEIKDYRILDCTIVGKKQFWCSLKLLKPNCDYYVRAFVVNNDETVSLGNIEKLHTKSFDRYYGKSDYANVWYAFNYTLFDLVTDEIIDPNDGFYYSTNENPTTVRHQVGTGYNTCYKFATEWNYKLWYYHNANHSDITMQVNPPIMSFSNGELSIEKNIYDTDKEISIYFSVNGSYFRPETYTDIYTKPIEITEPCVVCCYAISSDGYISYTNMYVVTNDEIGNNENVNSNISVQTKVFDGNSQPPIVGGIIEGYSNGDIIKKGIIVSILQSNLIYNQKYETPPFYYVQNDATHSSVPQDYKVIDCSNTNNEQFFCPLLLLKSDMDYYVKAYAVLKNGAIVYGNTESIHSKSFNRYNGSFDVANVWHAFDYTLFDLVTDEIINPNDGFYYSTNENPTTVRHQVGTSYNTCYKFATEWNYKLWLYNHTVHSDKTKMVSLPVMSFSNGRLSIERNPLDVDKDITIYYSINGNYFRPETYVNAYSTPIEITEPCTVYCYAISSDGYISYTNMYVVDINEGLTPNNDGEVDYGNGDVDENTDLNGNVVGNIYYNISDDNGEYSSTEGCIILRKPTSDTDMNNLEGQDIFGEDFKNGFTGIVFMVQAGSGTVKINAETVGNMTLKVKIGNSAPITMELEGKMKASFPYTVTEPTYVYIYGGETQTANARGLRATSSNNALKIYGIEWSEEASSIESIYGVSNADAVIYNLQGQRLQTVTKGINIVNGKKVIIK